MENTNLNNGANQISSLSGKTVGQRYNDFLDQKSAFRNMNGLIEMSPDINDTLKRLTEVVQPATPNLTDIIRTSIGNYGVKNLTLEKLWMDNIKEGANIIAVVDGVLGFYKDKEKLSDPTRVLRIPVLPLIYDLRKKERFLVLDQVKLQLKGLKKEIGH